MENKDPRSISTVERMKEPTERFKKYKKEAEEFMKNKDLTLEDFQKHLGAVFADKKDKLFLPKHHTWEEDGIQYSAWEISEGMFTGDGGWEMFNKAMQEEAEKIVPVNSGWYQNTKDLPAHKSTLTKAELENRLKELKDEK